MAATAAGELGRLAGARRRSRMFALAGLIGLAIVAALAELALGAVRVPPGEIVAILAGTVLPGVAANVDPVAETVVLSLRLPRLVLACLTGTALALAGAAFQGLFRNPLADPGLIGISSGAAVGAVVFIVLPWAVGPIGLLPDMYALPLSAMCGAIVAAGILFLVARRTSGIDIATVLLAGIAINALGMAVVGLMVFLSNEQQLTELSFWTLGSLARATWATVLPAIPWILVPVAVLVALARPVNALMLGEAEAGHLGIPVNRLKAMLLLAGACCVGATVALTGIIGFVGLVVPHIVRLLLGADNRLVFPAAAALGSALILGADLLARTVAVPAEVPIGVVTSLVGGPFFFWLICRRQRVALP